MLGNPITSAVRVEFIIWELFGPRFTEPLEEDHPIVDTWPQLRPEIDQLLNKSRFVSQNWPTIMVIRRGYNEPETEDMVSEAARSKFGDAAVYHELRYQHVSVFCTRARDQSTHRTAWPAIHPGRIWERYQESLSGIAKNSKQLESDVEDRIAEADHKPILLSEVLSNILEIREPHFFGSTTS